MEATECAVISAFPAEEQAYGLQHLEVFCAVITV